MSFTHGTSGYVNYHCRCHVCTEANRKRGADTRAKLKARGLPLGDPRHGTEGGYTNWGCRCELCTAANTAGWSERYRRGLVS